MPRDLQDATNIRGRASLKVGPGGLNIGEEAVILHVLTFSR
jgi:hypothetical protein